MSYIFEPSLKKIALLKISSILWTQDDIRTLIEKHLSFTRRRRFEIIVKKVIEKVQKLPELGQLKEEITGFIPPMGLQIFQWWHYHNSVLAQTCDLHVHVPAEFSWTPYGTIDRKETAKILIKDQTVDPVTRYKLSFIYCLEGDTEIIWNRIPEDCKYLICEGKYNPGVINGQDLAVFWTNLRLPLRMWEHWTGSYETAFRNAVLNDNKVAAEYFFQKLTPKEKEVCLVQIAQGANAEVLCFLLSQMDEEQRAKIFESDPYWFLKIVFDWPWSRFIVETANRLWDYEPKYYDDVFSPLLLIIDSRSICDDYVFRRHFRELWQCACDRFGADVCFTSRLLIKLFKIKDKEILGLVFRDVSHTMKRDFILSDSGIEFTKFLETENERDLLKFLVRQCLASEHEISEYNNKLREYILDYMDPFNFKDLLQRKNYWSCQIN